jgi:stress responsive alpha/beta barrel protein
MFIHVVYFWLHDDLAAADRERFVTGLRSLCAIEGVQHGYVGVPAATDRPVIDRSYSWGLVLVFENERAHEAYQIHLVHDRFRSECSRYWTAVRIYDMVSA